MAGGETFLEFEKFLLIFFTLECVSRYPIAPIIKIDVIMDGVKFITMLKDHMLPFAKDTWLLTPGRKIWHENDFNHRFLLIRGVI